MTTRPILPNTTARWLCAIVGLTVVLASVTDVAQPRPASAAAGDGIAAYISAPFVQGPPNSVGATVETFDTWTSCSSLPSSAVGTFSGSCDVHDGTSYEWGGAQTSSDTPTVQPGGTPSNFVSGPLTGVLTLTFSAPAKYVGFWWSAGSPSDEVKFYDSSNTLIATFTTATLSSRLGSSIPTSNPFPGPATLTAQDGTAYKRDYYWGRPYAYSTTTPTAIAYGGNVNRNAYAHAYLNVHASGSISFSKVEFVGNPFEFDNVAISTAPRTPDPSTVFIESVLGKSVDFRANGGTGSMATQTSDTATTLTPNAFTRAGYTFAGWHTTDSGTGGTGYGDQVPYGFGADMTLHAQWTPNPLDVTYDTQGGTDIAPGSTTTGASISASPGTPTREGYTFEGWFTEPSGGTEIDFTSPYVHGRTADFSVYAQWTANTLTITYDTQGGTDITAGATTTGASMPASPGTPTREGYTFAGWFTSATGGTALTFPYAHGQISAFTLFAQWVAVTTPSTVSPTTTTAVATSTATAAAPTTTATSTTTSPSTTAAAAVAVSARSAVKASTMPATGNTTWPAIAGFLLLILGAGTLLRRRPTR